jgi:hypothetical protein
LIRIFGKLNYFHLKERFYKNPFLIHSFDLFYTFLNFLLPLSICKQSAACTLFPPRAVTVLSCRILISQSLSEGHAKTRRDALVANNVAREGKEKRPPTNKYTVVEKMT